MCLVAKSSVGQVLGIEDVFGGCLCCLPKCVPYEGSRVKDRGQILSKLCCLCKCKSFGGFRLKDRRQILGRFVLFTKL